MSRLQLKEQRGRDTGWVRLAAALNVTGTLIAGLSPALAVPLVVAVVYHERWWPFLATSAIAALLGLGLRAVTPEHISVGPREGFLVVPLTWMGATGMSAIAYLLCGEPQLADPVDAFFESMSGFTTTGSTVLTDVEAIDHSVLMWRQFTQWLGGMGIIVLALAVLPRLRVGGRQLFQSEAPGSETQPLTTSIRETARRFWAVYIALTVVLAVALVLVGTTGADPNMTPFRAVAHAFTTMPTGGFSTEQRGLEIFDASTQWIVIVFMVVAGINFALLADALLRGRVRTLLADNELRLYALILVVVSVVLAAELIASDVLALSESTIRQSVFQAVSIVTTTGYANVDFALWPGVAAITIVGLMFVGGSAGSTSGSIKVVRHLLIARILRRELDHTIHPELVSQIRLNGRAIDERTLRAIITFVLLYIGLFAAGAAIIAISQTSGAHTSPIDAIAAAASAIGNVGPGLGFAGPMGSFAPFNTLSKTVMTALMLLGRLELITVLVLFTPAYWRE